MVVIRRYVQTYFYVMGNNWSRVAFLSTTQSVFGSLPEQIFKRSLGGVGTVFRIGQCGYCKRFWAETLPKLKEAYINTGKARFGYRHFAILGKHSEQAALASECAAEQGKFWEYHDQLFKNQGGLAFTETKLKQYARDIGLNVGVLGACLETGKYRQKVERETEAAANLGGRGTPLFIVNQRPLVGAQPYGVFQKMIDEELASQEAKQKTK